MKPLKIFFSDNEFNDNGKKLLEGCEECFLGKRLKTLDKSDPRGAELTMQNSYVACEFVARTRPALGAICGADCGDAIGLHNVALDGIQVELDPAHCQDHATDTDRTACRTLLAARKCKVTHVSAGCPGFVAGRLDVEKVCEVLEFAVEHDLEDLVTRCCTLVSQRAADVLPHPGFLRCGARVLLVALSLDSLAVPSEAVVSDACVRWAEAQCLRARLEPSRERLRSVLGPALGRIRFLSMTAAQLVGCSAFERLLTDDEARSILINIIKPRSCRLPSGICVDSSRRGWQGR